MSEVKEFTPSPEQAVFLDWIQNGSGSAVLEAVAGAGKTSTLIKGVALMSGSVFLGAYNKKIADELKVRLAGMTGKKAGTFHSAGYSALFRGNKNIEINGNKVRDIVSGLVKDNEELEITEFKSAVCNLVSLAKQTGFYIQSMIPNVQRRYYLELIARYDVADALPDEEDWNNSLVEYADRALHISNDDHDVIDFDDMIYQPLLRNIRLFQNDWVLIDEAQDTNAIRRELAKRMLRRGGRLIAVGDPHQAIYGFTGADSNSLNLIKDMFQAITLKLSVSWRCPRSVVAVANEYVSHIHPAETADAGTVTSMAYKDMVKKAAAGDAVLCRFNAPLIDLCFNFIREGKPAKIEGRAIGEGLIALVGRWKLTTINQVEARLKIWFDKEAEKIRESSKPDEGKLEKLEDKHLTLQVLMTRAREQGLTTLDQLKDMIRSMFDDVGSSKTVILLCSVHRSKGLEWPNVYILGRNEIMPSTRATQKWQIEQEINLCYVAVTRAQENLIDVRMPVGNESKKPA